MDGLTPNEAALKFALVAALGASLLFGFIPAMAQLRGVGSGAFCVGENAPRTTSGKSTNRIRQVLVILEVAASLVLLIGAGLLMQSFRRLSGVPPGFDPRSVSVMLMSLNEDRFAKAEDAALLMQHTREGLESIPGVIAAGAINSLPLETGIDWPFEIVGRPVLNDRSFPDEQLRTVTPHYFSTMRIPVLNGRAFTDRDTRDASGVVVVNGAFARKYFPGQNPLGQSIVVGRMMGPAFADVPRRIIGVVGDTREQELGADPPPVFFEPIAQLPNAMNKMNATMSSTKWVIRTSGQMGETGERIGRAVLKVAGGVPLSEPVPLERIVAGSIARQKFSMTLMAVFAGLALAMGSIGLYGVITYSAVQRTREFGIRSALGAKRGDLFRSVFGEGMTLTLIGAGGGLVASAMLSRFLSNQLYGVTATDPEVFGSVTMVLITVSLIASCLPARRAALVDPLEALRQ